MQHSLGNMLSKSCSQSGYQRCSHGHARARVFFSVRDFSCNEVRSDSTDCGLALCTKLTIDTVIVHHGKIAIPLTTLHSLLAAQKRSNTPACSLGRETANGTIANPQICASCTMKVRTVAKGDAQSISDVVHHVESFRRCDAFGERVGAYF